MELNIIENKIIRMVFHEENGIPMLLENKKTGLNFLKTGPQPLFLLTLSDHNEEKVFSAEDASTVFFEKIPNGYLIHYNLLGIEALSARCKIVAEEDRIVFSIEVDNQTSYHLEQVEYPCFILPDHLQSKEEDWVLYTHGFFSGILIHGFDAVYTEDQTQWGASYVEPVQMTACGTDDQTLYFATNDTNYYSKHMQPLWLGDRLKLSTTHFIDEYETEYFTLPYSAEIRILQSGDWQDAALQYREWTQKQWWCEKRLDERDDVADWWLKSPIVLSIKERAKRNSDPQQRVSPWCHPLVKGIPHILEVADHLKSTVNVQVFHWEQNGAFVNPDHFPPLSGWEGTREFFNQLHENGHFGGLYILPLRWCLKAYTTGYDGSKFFKEHKALEGFALSKDKKPIPSASDWNWRKRLSVCAAHKPVQDLIVDSFVKVSNLGADYIQFDTFNGVLYDCWSDKHGHYPGRGRWQIGETIEMIKRCRDTENPYVFTFEANPVPELIPYVHGFVERGYQPCRNRNWERVPMFQFLFHPYSQGFAGEEIGEYTTVDNFFMANGNTIVNGDMLMVNLDEEGRYATITHEPDSHNVTIDREIPVEVIEDYYSRLNHMRRDIARDFLITGQMEKDPEIQCELGKLLPAEGNTVKRFPAVLARNWSNRDGEVVTVLVNYTETAQEIKLRTAANCTVCFDNDSMIPVKPDGEYAVIEVPALTSAMVKYMR